jgi:hypothetical protein
MKNLKDFNNEWEARKHFGEKPFEKDLKEIIIKMLGVAFTVWGLLLIIINRDLTNGFLALILGELVDLKYKFK